MLIESHIPEPCSAAEWSDVTVRYPFARTNAVGPVRLTIQRGERVLLLGASGSGKSTLLMTLTGIIPKSLPAEVTGDRRIGGEDVATREPSEWASEVSQYFQDADQTLCGMRVEDEVAFALENRNVPEAEIILAVGSIMQEVGLPDAWRLRRTSTLSGGEKQLVALAATLVQRAPLLVVDEPTAHLSPAATERLHTLLARGDPAQTVVIVDHRLDGLIQWIDRVIVLGPEGGIVAEGEPRAIFRTRRDLLDELGIWSPACTRLDGELAALDLASPRPPLTVAEALEHLQPEKAAAPDIERARPAVLSFLDECRAAASSAAHAPVLVTLSGATCAPFWGPSVLHGLDLAIREGEIVGILGANGAGKSTLGLCLAGLLPLREGDRTGAAGGVAFQRSESQFVSGSVGEELDRALPSCMPPFHRKRHVTAALDTWRLSGLAERHPYELSQGQKRRLALATLTMTDRWPLLVLDEPMAGLDAAGAAVLSDLILRQGHMGRAVAVITHDMDMALRLCPRSIILSEGRILADGDTGDLLRNPQLLARAGLSEPSCAVARRWLERVGAC